MSNNSLDIASIITDCKKDFTRDRKSAIRNFLVKHNNSVIISHLNKSRGPSVKIYTLKGDAVKAYDLVVKNAKIVLRALVKNGVTIYSYNKHDNNITLYNMEEEEV